MKVTKGKELLDEAKRTYEQLNSELHDELPALYDSRVLFLVTNLQTLFAAEQVFHAESAKVRLNDWWKSFHVLLIREIRFNSAAEKRKQAFQICLLHEREIQRYGMSFAKKNHDENIWFQFFISISIQWNIFNFVFL